MSVQLSDLVPGAVAVASDGKMYVVVSLSMNRPARPVNVKKTAGGTTYVAPVSMFKAVVGQVDLAKFDGAVAVSTDAGAYREPMFGAGVMPENIKAMNLKYGDLIQVRHGSGVREAVFQGFKWTRPMYPVSYAINGKGWKGPMSSIVGKVQKVA